MRRIFREIKWWWQRRTRGFDDCAMWGLDVHLAKLILPRLRAFKSVDRMGHPCLNPMGCVPEYGDAESKADSEQWEAELDLMIEAFDYIVRQDDDICMLDKSIYYPEADRRDAIKVRGLKLFGERFQALWD